MGRKAKNTTLDEDLENTQPKDESETAVEPEETNEAKDLADHISAAGNQMYDEGQARSGIGEIKYPNTTAAHIEIVQSRQPALEAAMRAEATSRGLADGSIKPEDAPGNQMPEDGIILNDGGSAEHGNSRTDVPDTLADPNGEKRDKIAAEADPVSQLTASKGSNADGTATGSDSQTLGDSDKPSDKASDDFLGETKKSSDLF